MNDLTLERIIDVQQLILKLRSIKRITYNPDDGYENDVEHSFSLAFMAWMLAPKLEPALDPLKLNVFAMIHDLVEVYAGDTFCFASQKELESKPKREAAALQRLVKEFSDFPQLVTALQEYEDLESKEAQFIYALDKLQPIILNYLDGGRVWKENNITFTQMFDNKLKATAINPKIHSYVLDLAFKLNFKSNLFSPYKYSTKATLKEKIFSLASAQLADI